MSLSKSDGIKPTQLQSLKMILSSFSFGVDSFDYIGQVLSSTL